MALHPQKVGYGISVGGHVLLVVAGLVGFLTSPTKVDEGESVPVEIVSDEPAQSTRGDRRGEQTPTPQRVVDRQAPEERQTQDPATLPVARERVQTTDVPPPPPPRPAQADPRPPEPTPPVRQAQAAPPPPPVPVPQPAPRPTPAAAAAQEREDQAAKEAELLAQQKREEERRQQEQQRQAEARRQQEIRERQQREARERQEREQREARERQEREQRERQAREQRERQQREARERAERQRQEQADARRFDPNSIAARLASSSTQENDRRQASRTEATGATAPARTASLGTATGAAARITGREIDAIRAWAERCWEVPIAAREGNSPAVRLRVSFNRDGTVSARPEIQNPRGDPAFQILANSAVRAVMRCSQEGGVRLPPERYDTWREVVLNFDPKEMMR
ncbi:cell envelope integrity protein TolA [Phreatobacter sp.]|uniref:cell envelope integrity protein TolA n=1 Tax=Phreatobacter sp. TaxID=1966341 RepID=UPI0022CBA967|nr:cell envelope integrity protein TolA [Phreatobacter sp.]MCZ8315383.1 cell envelope integrity protein TolA [Phreatobacter sp.]